MNADDIKMSKTLTYNILGPLVDCNKSFNTKKRLSKDERLDHFQLGNQERYQREGSNRASLEICLENFQGQRFPPCLLG